MGPLTAVPNTLILKHGSREVAATVEQDGRVRIGDRDVHVVVQKDGSMRFPELPGLIAWAVADGDSRWVFVDGRVYEFKERGQISIFDFHRISTAKTAYIENRDLTPGAPGAPGARRKRGGSHHGSLMAPMPATVLRIVVSVGDHVARGDTLIILEAMKMELPVKAAAAGTVQAVNCREGELVQPGTALVELDEDE
jgi:biotin carboxyl carrier protein